MIFTIIARKWFEKLNGNTYHSTEVYKNGVLLERVPFQYGYGKQWDQTAAQVIARQCPRLWKNANKKAYPNGSKYSLAYGSDIARYTKHKVITSVTDVTRRKDL